MAKRIQVIDDVTGKVSFDETTDLTTIANASGIQESIIGAATIDSNMSYALERSFIYAGTNNVDAITSIKVNAYRLSGMGDFNIRIVRGSDGAVICELTGQTTTDDSVLLDLGTISNLPTEHSVLEVQGEVSNGSTTAFLGSIYFEG